MLLGLDLKKIDMVIFLQPYNELAPVIQGGGRGGRKKLDGFRNSVQVYQLWNPEDLTKRNKLMSQDMRTLCRTGTTACTRQFLKEIYRIGNERMELLEELSDEEGCCMFHDLLQLGTNL